MDSGDVAVIMDPKLERSINERPDDRSQPSYGEEELVSDASNVSLPSGSHHWMDTRLQTRLREGGTRPYYQQLSFSIDSEDEPPDVLPFSALPEAEPNEPTVTVCPLNPQRAHFLWMKYLFPPHYQMKLFSKITNRCGKNTARLETNADAVRAPTSSAHGHLFKHRDMISQNPSTQGARTASSKEDTSQPVTRRQRIQSSYSDSTRTAHSAQLSSDPETEPDTTARDRLRKKRTPKHCCGTCGQRDCVCLLQMNAGCPTKTRGVHSLKNSRAIWFAD